MFWQLLALAFLASVTAESRCRGSPLTFNGKPCASTTHYHDGHKGACGCGPASGDSQFGWNHNMLTTAPNQRFFDDHGSSWCGHACGRCVKLTTTGGYVNGQGGSVAAGQSYTFMVTNLCPNEFPNLSWCNQDTGHTTNQYGYAYHFDLEDAIHQVTNKQWNNPEVTWEWTSCGHDGAPSSGQFQHCQCGR